jgi:hypothetical protein
MGKRRRPPTPMVVHAMRSGTEERPYHIRRLRDGAAWRAAVACGDPSDAASGTGAPMAEGTGPMSGGCKNARAIDPPLPRPVDSIIVPSEQSGAHCYEGMECVPSSPAETLRLARSLCAASLQRRCGIRGAGAPGAACPADDDIRRQDCVRSRGEAAHTDGAPDGEFARVAPLSFRSDPLPIDARQRRTQRSLRRRRCVQCRSRADDRCVLAQGAAQESRRAARSPVATSIAIVARSGACSPPTCAGVRRSAARGATIAEIAPHGVARLTEDAVRTLAQRACADGARRCACPRGTKIIAKDRPCNAEARMVPWFGGAGSGRAVAMPSNGSERAIAASMPPENDDSDLTLVDGGCR